MKNLVYYCQNFSNLNVSSNKERGKANYKPILLLSVIDLITRSVIMKNEIYISDELIETFNNYWNVLGSPSYKGGLHYPFLHLQGDDFWHLKFKLKFNGLQPKTTNKLKEAVEYAYLDSELFYLLQSQDTRKELLDALVLSWFSFNEYENKEKTEDILQINQNFQEASLEAEKSFEFLNKVPTPRWSMKKSLIRNAFFRKTVVHIYNYTCAFCGLKVTKLPMQNIVDGAHIKPFSHFYDNNINNGISFCKNHHWAFDLGWFTVDEQYKIIVDKDLEEEYPSGKPMKDFHGKQLLLPNAKQYFPCAKALEWHRKNVFQA